MQRKGEIYLSKVNRRNAARSMLQRMLLILALMVTVGVFWRLKLTGLTLAGEAFCGLEEHVHSEECLSDEVMCEKEEHVHLESCYSNLEADVETSDDWEKTLPEMAVETSTAERVIAIAKSQLGYTESELNFQVDGEAERRGYTRYGEWYGNPYGNWSTMFVSFCLSYGEAEDVPVSSSAESMLAQMESAGLYKTVDNYLPVSGNILFLDKNENGSVETTAIITSVSNGQIHAVEGEVDGCVAETIYTLGDSMICGYGQIEKAEPIQLGEGAKLIAQTEQPGQELFVDGNHLVVYIDDGSGYYAIDGNGEFVQIEIDVDGKIYTYLETPEVLLWDVLATDETGGYQIVNLVTQIALPENCSPISTFALTNDNSGAESGNNYQYARAVDYTVWLDGTNGGLMSYGDSPNQSYTVSGGSTFQLPMTWQSSSEYNYRLKGWYDVVNNVYYEPGAQITVNGNMVFYADWVADSYDIGQYNELVADTVSTNGFVTTRMFDYGILFNVLSSLANVTVSNTEHLETWNLITNGNSPYSGQPTLNYIFRDWDKGSMDITYPVGVYEGLPHYPTAEGSVYSGLYNDRIGTLLFDPDTEVIGKEYLGTADHLFQFCDDPEDEYYGYYYYDSARNAASYNQTDARFYVYDYLEQTTVSLTTTGKGQYSDFLPFNSPYANTYGKNPPLYRYDGQNGEYVGAEHYMYDATNENVSNVATNFLFGMSIDIDFYLPTAPGSGGNKDIYGKDMHFKFSGDDDVWVFIDGMMVLDLGGIHGVESGDINFTTGVVTINGVENADLSNTLRSISSGEHVLTLYYLERGSSMSNCAICFNLAPRFSFSIQKEDVLTKEELNGAQFSVYTDKECTIPAELWVSKEIHDQGVPSQNVFTVTDGVAEMWGMGAGNTYYIKETQPPDNEEYGYANGIICVFIDKQGLATYSVELIEEGDKGISNGFTVHGFRIDEETQSAYIVATNAPKWVKETTNVWAFKKWNDDKNHSDEVVTVYLTITDPDGTVRRLQEAQLGAENGWKYCWENLPKYAEDGVTEIQYGVEESYVSGYFSKVEESNDYSLTTTRWTETTTLEHSKSYLLRTDQGYLSTMNGDSDTGYQWVTREEAEASPLALWTARFSGNRVMLTNQANQTISFYYGNGNPTDFFASTDQGESNEVKRYFNYSVWDGRIFLYFDTYSTDYFLTGNRNNSNKFTYDTNIYNSMLITPMLKEVVTVTEKLDGESFRITNTPLDKETSLSVYKAWDYGYAVPDDSHEKAQVTVELWANGKQTGRTVTLNLKNRWQGTFQGLPYTDDEGNVIVYSVKERWESGDWIPHYEEINVTDGKVPAYSTQITNVYRWGHGAILPSTGTAKRLMYVLCGGGIMLLSLICGLRSRRKRERRMK